MTLNADRQDLANLILQNEIALRRARRMVAFMRVVSELEAQVLSASVESSARSEPLAETTPPARSSS